MVKRLISLQRTGNGKRLKPWRPRVEWMEPRALLSAVSWTGGGGDNNWDTPANWNTNAVPGAADDVTIAIAANVVHSNNLTDSINSLTSSEPLTISGGTLSIAAASSITNTLSITGGTLTGAGNLTVSGLVTLSKGTLSGSSALNANGGMLINPPDNDSSGFAVDGRTINNAANQTATWTGSNNTVQVSDGGVFNNLGTFLAENSGSYADTGNGAASSFVNDGTYTQSGSGFVQFFVPFNVPGGTVNVQDGTLDLERGGTSTGGIFNLTGLLKIGNQLYNIDPTTTITGSGGLDFDGVSGPQILPSDYTYTAPTNVVNSDLQVDGNIRSSAFNNFGNLSGTGTVGSLGGEGGDLSPGDGANPGILNVQNNLDFSQGDWVFKPLLNGPTVGTGYSQLNVGGSVKLANADLEVVVGVAPSPGQTFTIIKSNAPINGEFSGLAEGASFVSGSTTFTITYVGGTGHDVVLDAVSTGAPAVAGLDPTSGPEAGGTQVTISGAGFTGATAVKFGPTAAASFTVVNDSTITATSPAGSGAVDVTVTTPNGTSEPSSVDQFTYTAVAGPIVTSIFPTSGPSTGSTTVEIDGFNFTGATEVDFGATPVTGTGFVVSSDNAILASAPPGTGVVHVTVKTPLGTSATSPADQFTYTAVAAPTVTGLSPTNGPAAGGTQVTITGTGFTGATDVHFGTIPASFLVDDDTTITVASPAGSGIVDVTVTTPAGTSAVSNADKFTYNQIVAPTVTGLSPSSGPSAGGTAVTITGTGFSGATQVEFGTTSATNLVVLDDTTIMATSPAGNGVLNVTVVTPAGTSPASHANEFTYTAVAAPSITGLSPTSGPAAGGTPVTITGTGFTGATQVEFGTIAATNLVVVNGSTITVDSPPGTGVVDVTVTTPGGTSANSEADQFTFTAVTAPTVTGLSPTSGPATGGTAVTITGTGFTGATEVDFGTTAATGLVVVNDTTITVNSPAGNGIADVTVKTPNGVSAVSPAAQFSYQVTPFPSEPTAPTVVTLVRFGFHAQPTSLVLTFSSPLDATRAEDVHNFMIVTLGGKGKNGNLVGHVTPVRSAVYDPSTLTVTLFTAQRLDIHNLYQLTVNGMTPSGLTGATGVPLAGQGNMSGTNYVKVISGKLLAGPAPSTSNAARRPKAAPDRVIKGPSAAALDQLLASGNWTARPNSARSHGGHHHRRG